MCIPGWPGVLVENAVPDPSQKILIHYENVWGIGPVIYIVYKILQVILKQVAQDALS